MTKSTPHARGAPSAAIKAPVNRQAVNQLIEALPSADRAHLVTACVSVELVLGDILYEPGTRLRYAYFPLGGFVSLLSATDGHAQLELGLIGDEGMHGASLALGVAESSQRALVQGSGPALRITTAAMRRELRHSPALRRLLGRYLHVLMAQQAQNAVCICFHLLEQRLARWLLMTRDRAHADAFLITHLFLASMLGVRREGVTEAAGALQKRGMIRYTRGRITITDRRALESAACVCYRHDRATWQRWLG
ncbi:MAG: Crp/Fnr family transcriptional regulator [Rhodanobacter sp.]